MRVLITVNWNGTKMTIIRLMDKRSTVEYFGHFVFFVFFFFFLCFFVFFVFLSFFLSRFSMRLLFFPSSLNSPFWDCQIGSRRQKNEMAPP